MTLLSRFSAEVREGASNAWILPSPILVKSGSRFRFSFVSAQVRQQCLYVGDQHVDRVELTAAGVSASGRDVLAGLRRELVEQRSQVVDRVLNLTLIDVGLCRIQLGNERVADTRVVDTAQRLVDADHPRHASRR